MENTFKDKLMNALHSAVGYFNQNGDPNMSVVKAASDFGFNVDQTSRLIETFNTARTIYHYKSASDRTQTFALADPTVVIPGMFQETEEKAASFVTNDYSEYDRPEFNYTDNMVVKSGGVHDDVKDAEVTSYLDTNLDTLCARANRILRTQRDLAKTARDEANVCGTRAAQLLTKLARIMSTGYEEQCADRFSRLFGGYAKNANYAPVMDKFAEFVPRHYKVAAADDVVIDDRDLDAEVNLLKEAKEYMEAEAEFLGYASVLEKEASTFEAEFMGMVVTQLPAEPVKTASVIDLLNSDLIKQAIKSVDTEKKQEPFFQFGPLGGKDSKPSSAEDILGGGVAAVKKPVEEHISTGINKMLFGPTERENRDLSERLKNVHRQIMLQDLMTNDPVLSDEDPQTVANAYEAVLNMAPDLASNKEVIRAILRQTVHAVAVSPYEAEQWTKLEQNIRNITGKTDAKGVPIKR